MKTQKISFKRAAPGMKLAKPIVNENGMTLCGAGTELTAELIDRLSKMDVAKIVVEGHPVDTGEPEKGLAQHIEELNHRFRKVSGDPLLREVRDIVLRRLEERYGE